MNKPYSISFIFIFTWIISSSAYSADVNWWHTSSPNAPSGQITLKNSSGTSKTVNTNPTGATLLTRSANTQPPTVIIQATGSGIMTLLPTSTACDAAHENQVRINSSRILEYCNPTTHAWQAVATGSSGGTQLYSAGGTYSWTVPTGISSVTLWAGGEGGGYGGVSCCWPDYSGWMLCPARFTPGNSSYVTGPTGIVVAGYGGQSGDSGGANGGWFGQSGAAISLDGYTAGRGMSSWGGIGKSTVSVSSGTTYTIVVAGGGGLCQNNGVPTTSGFVAIIY